MKTDEAATYRAGQSRLDGRGIGNIQGSICVAISKALRAVLYSSAPHANKARTGGIRDRELVELVRVWSRSGQCTKWIEFYFANFEG